MQIVFIKAGGSGNIVRKPSTKIDYPRLFYRQLTIDDKYFQTLVDCISSTTRKLKIGLSIGGVGAYLFLNFAKEMGMKGEKFRQIGCDIINITSSILIESFKNKGVNVCPKLIEVNNNLEDTFSKYDLFLMKASTRYWSSDSSVAHAASKISHSKLLYFKTSLLKRIGNNHNLNIDYLYKLAGRKRESVQGMNPVIDLEAIKYIEKNKINTSICNRELIKVLDKIIEGKYTSKYFLKVKI